MPFINMDGTTQWIMTELALLILVAMLNFGKGLEIINWNKVYLGNTNKNMFPFIVVVSENISAHDDNDSSCKSWLQDY
jgi:isocitrate dehydrogenase